MSEPDPNETLREARQCVRSQQFAAALEKYIWFHHHALESDPALTGVRLSYALSEWVDLGELYPPARRALELVRDATAESLMRGAYEVALFRDVASINRALGQVERTRDLFTTIVIADRTVAEKFFHIALESLVHANAFDIARSFISDPRKEIDQLSTEFKLAHQYTSDLPEELHESLGRIYVKKVSITLQVFIGTGEEAVANQLRDYALESVSDSPLRDKIMEWLYSSPPLTHLQ